MRMLTPSEPCCSAPIESVVAPSGSMQATRMAIVSRFFMTGLPALHSRDDPHPRRAAIGSAPCAAECNLRQERGILERGLACSARGGAIGEGPGFGSGVRDAIAPETMLD